VARPRELKDLDCGEPFGRAAVRVVEVRCAEVLEHSEGVLDVADIERVHDMRVATRRLRAAMEVFASCFPRKRHKASLQEVKAIAGALGDRRDADVAIAELEGFGVDLGPADRIGIATLLRRLRIEQEEANRRLRPFVTSDRLAALARDIGAMCGAARERSVDGKRG
jgi:CHAD domain-containing protein